MQEFCLFSCIALVFDYLCLKGIFCPFFTLELRRYELSDLSSVVKQDQEKADDDLLFKHCRDILKENVILRKRKDFAWLSTLAVSLNQMLLNMMSLISNHYHHLNKYHSSW